MNQFLRFLIIILPILILIFFTRILLIDEDTQLATFEAKNFPSFELDDLNGRPVLSESLGGIKLINVWASWCITCLVEHPFLKKVTESKDVNLVGINYKDQDFNAKKYLIDNGDPYSFSIYDLSGNFSLKLGVTGAPETFLVIDGVIVSHRIGEVNMEVWNEKFAQYF